MYTINVEINDKFIYRHHNENEQSHLNTLENLKILYGDDLWFIFDDESKHPTFVVRRYVE